MAWTVVVDNLTLGDAVAAELSVLEATVSDGLTLTDGLSAELPVLETALGESLIVSEGIVLVFGVWNRRASQGSARQGQGTRGHMEFTTRRRPAGGSSSGAGSIS